MNRFLSCLLLAAMTTPAFAQSGTNSPYSQYGLGDLSDQGVGFNKGMNGVGLAFHRGWEVNPLNPASYSSVDSLSMIFDAGLSGQITNYNENGTKLNGKTGGFDYAVGLFRAFKNVGVSFGVMPYSNVGYKYSTTTRLTDMQTSVVSTYQGSGGFNQLFIGAGWKIFKPISFGFNFSYLWGDANRNITTSSNSTINNLSKKYEVSVSSYKLDLGLQFMQPLSKTDMITIGAVYSPGHKLKADPTCDIISTNSSISKSDTTSFTITNGLSLPTTYGVGIGYNHGTTLRVGADLQIQKWGGLDFPAYENENYTLHSGLLKDSYKVNAGLEWLPRMMSRRFFERVRYRIGAGYTTPYYNINGHEGPKAYGVSVGFGIPIMNGYNNRSVLNISAQWQHRSADQLITENTFRINIGLTFNERWFAKWKVE